MNEGSRSHAGLIWACIASILLLAIFSSLHWVKSEIINLPVQWLWVSISPILLALIAGGYVGKLKAAGIEFELDPRLRALPYVAQSSNAKTKVSKEVSTEAFHIETAGRALKFWTSQRSGEYDRTNNLSLVHAYVPSKLKGQRYDITIFLMRHIPGHGGNEISGLDDIEKAEFFFGPSWGNRIFVAENEGEVIGVRTSAWGTFLAVCRVTFRASEAKEPITLFRYIDFEMAPDRQR